MAVIKKQKQTVNYIDNGKKITQKVIYTTHDNWIQIQFLQEEYPISKFSMNLKQWEDLKLLVDSCTKK